MIILAINIARQKPHIKSEAGDGWKQQIKAIPQAQTTIQHQLHSHNKEISQT